MLGTLFGLSGLAFYIGTTATDGWQVSGWSLVFTGLLMCLGGAVVGIVFRLTVGIAAMWCMIGAAIGGVVALVKGEPAIGLPLFVQAVAFFGLQHFLAAVHLWVRGRQSRPRGPVTPSQPARMSSRGYYGVVDPTMLSQGGPGTMAVFHDGDSEFITDRGVRWRIGVADWASWRFESRPEVLAEIPGLRQGAVTLVLNGGIGLMLPAIYVQPDQVDEWTAWAQQLNIAEEAR